MKSLCLRNLATRSNLANYPWILGNSSFRFSSTSDNKKDDPIYVLPANFAEDEIMETPKPANFFNKSGLRPQHLKLLRDEKPYENAQSWIHNTEKYQRKMYGRYGGKSNVNPRICFPTKTDVENQLEYERVAYPHSLEYMLEKAREEKETKRKQILQREEDVAKKLEKLDQWKSDLLIKVAKKEAEAVAAKERKERLIEEVRQHFGFKVDPKDERFKELLEQKEKEDRKKAKEAKRKIKEDKIMAKLLESPPNFINKEAQS